MTLRGRALKKLSLKLKYFFELTDFFGFLKYDILYAEDLFKKSCSIRFSEFIQRFLQNQKIRDPFGIQRSNVDCETDQTFPIRFLFRGVIFSLKVEQN